MGLGHHPHESLHYNGPEFDGLTPDEKFDLAKQLRIRARNARIGLMIREREIARAKRDSFRRQAFYGAILIVNIFVICFWSTLHHG